MRLGPDDWKKLSALPAKWRAYAEDPFFRECWDDCVRVLGAGAFAALQGTALVLFKPEARFHETYARTVSFLQRRGFAAIDGRAVRVDYWSCRELWRYQWGELGISRIRACEFLMRLDESFLVLLHDRSAERTLPASVRLSSVKGTTAREPGSLRELLGGRGAILTYVHTSDEPADVVRELGVLLETEVRRSFLEAIREVATETGRSGPASSSRKVPWPAAASGACEEALRADRALPALLLGRFGQGSDAWCLLRELEASRHVPFDRFWEVFSRVGPALDGWELVALAALCHEGEAGSEPEPALSGRRCLAGWRRGEGTVVEAGPGPGVGRDAFRRTAGPAGDAGGAPGPRVREG